MPDLDDFEFKVLGALALRDHDPAKVARAVLIKFRVAGLVDNIDLKPGKPNYTKGKWAIRVTQAGKDMLAQNRIRT